MFVSVIHSLIFEKKIKNFINIFVICDNISYRSLQIKIKSSVL